MQGTWVSLSLFWFCTSYIWGSHRSLSRLSAILWRSRSRPARGHGLEPRLRNHPDRVEYICRLLDEPVRLQRQPSGSTMQGTWVSLSLFWFCTSYGRHTYCFPTEPCSRSGSMRTRTLELHLFTTTHNNCTTHNNNFTRKPSSSILVCTLWCNSRFSM